MVGGEAAIVPCEASEVVSAQREASEAGVDASHVWAQESDRSQA